MIGNREEPEKQKADSKQEEKDGITAGGGIIKAGSK